MRTYYVWQRMSDGIIQMTTIDPRTVLMNNPQVYDIIAEGVNVSDARVILEEARADVSRKVRRF